MYRSSLNASTQESSDRLVQTQARVVALQEQLAAMEREKLEQSARTRQLEVALQDEETRSRQYQNRLREAEAHCDELQRSKRDMENLLRQELSQLQKQTSGLQQELTGIRNGDTIKRHHRDDMIAGLRQQLSDAEQEVARSHIELRDMEVQMQRNTSIQEEMTAERNAEITRLLATVEALNAELRVFQTVREPLTQTPSKSEYLLTMGSCSSMSTSGFERQSRATSRQTSMNRSQTPKPRENSLTETLPLTRSKSVGAVMHRSSFTSVTPQSSSYQEYRAGTVDSKAASRSSSNDHMSRLEAALPVLSHQTVSGPSFPTPLGDRQPRYHRAPAPQPSNGFSAMGQDSFERDEPVYRTFAPSRTTSNGISESASSSRLHEEATVRSRSTSASALSTPSFRSKESHSSSTYRSTAPSSGQNDRTPEMRALKREVARLVKGME